MKILNRQSLLDIAIQYLGNAQAAFSIAFINGISLTDDLVPQQKIELPNTEYYNRDIANYYTEKGLKPATALSENLENIVNNDGIGWMYIENTFIVR